MGCCRDGVNDSKTCKFPGADIIRGLKAKLIYQSCDLTCSPADRCVCESVKEEIRLAEDWIRSLPGEESRCDG